MPNPTRISSSFKVLIALADSKLPTFAPSSGNPCPRRAKACAVLVVLLSLLAKTGFAKRRFEPEDLFRIHQVGDVAWSNDGLYAAIEMRAADRTLDTSVPTGDLHLVDVKTHRLRKLTAKDESTLGFFDPV